jgi:hypothetical protein
MENKFKRFTTNNVLVNVGVAILYLMWCYFGMQEIKTEHYFLVGLWLVAFYLNKKSRRFIKAFSFFIVFWVLYDSMRVFPNYEFNTVHIQQPYELEKWLFGILDNGIFKTPNEYFLTHNNLFLDFISGFFYINWMPIPIGFGVYLYLKDKKLFLDYAMAFLLVNMVGFILYYVYPAAPPWYVQDYGFNLQIGIPGSRAGLERFDRLLGYPVFEGIYNKNANVLAAMPSLHSAYPVVVLYYSFKKKLSAFTKALFVLFLFGIWFSAVYSSHHYIIDVVTGVVVALFVLLIFEKILKLKCLKRFRRLLLQ